MYIQGSDRLTMWKDYFQNLLSADQSGDSNTSINPVLEITMADTAR